MTGRALQPEHAGGVPTAIGALYLDRLSGVVAKQNCQLGTLRHVTLLKHDYDNLRLRIGVRFQNTAGNDKGRRVLLALSAREHREQKKNCKANRVPAHSTYLVLTRCRREQ